MKRFNLWIGLWIIGTAIFGAGTAHAEDMTKPQPVDAQYVFVPTGYDDSDRIEIVVDGFMPSTCYQQAKPDSTVDIDTKIIAIQPLATVSEGPCLLVLVPYTAVVNIGTLPEGEYTIHVAGVAPQTLIVRSQPAGGPANTPFIPVEHAQVRVLPEEHRIELLLDGSFTNTCMAIDQVSVQDDGSTIFVLPLMKMEEHLNCEDRSVPYQPVLVELPWRGSGRYLAHIRGFGDKNANEVFTVYGE